MQKTVVILVVLLLVTNCSVSKFKAKERSGTYDYEAGSLEVNKLEDYNLTNLSFYIQKADIEVISRGGKESLLASVKYRFPDSYLISLRTRTGIEAARVLIRSDSVFINDRINRAMYYGS
ncbi:MAG: DUF4292 domain-containing protein, partial [Bacteroidales bacterium]|nr:DUF4292 domain-containing protein [Bacteroidales bacterium]